MSITSPSSVLPNPADLKLVLYPDPVLRKRAREVTEFTPWLQEVAEKMKLMMVEHKGVGLAAPQVGLGIRMFVMSPTGEAKDAIAIVNPELSEQNGEQNGEEGCLSLPDIRIKVNRFYNVRVKGVTPTGEPLELDLEEWTARIAQHEYDHLEGIMLIDRMSQSVRMKNRQKIKELEEAAGVTSGKKK